MKEAGVAAFTLHPLPPRSTSLFCVQATAKRHFKGSCRAMEMFSLVSLGCRCVCLKDEVPRRCFGLGARSRGAINHSVTLRFERTRTEKGKEKGI